MKKNNSFEKNEKIVCKALVLFILILASHRVLSQTCDSAKCHCEKSDLNPSGIMIGHTHPKGRWMFSYRYMDMRMKDNLFGTKRISDDVIFQDYLMSAKSMNMDMHMVMAMYGITDRLSIMAMFNYNLISMDMSMLPGTMTSQMNGMTMSDLNTTKMTTKTYGIGDTKLYGVYNLLDKDENKLVFSLGLSIPTGSIKMKGNDQSMLPGMRLPFMMQMGSGTYDFLPGITYLLNKETFSWGAQATGIIRKGYNNIGYAFGNEATVNTWLAIHFLPCLSISTRLEGNYTEVIYGGDPQVYKVIEPDANTKNYGGIKVNGYVGLNIYLKQIANSKISFEYGSPLYQNLNGPQLATRSILYTGWTISF